MFNPGTIGGLLLIIGAYALYKGSALWSIIFYGIADIMWLILAYQAGDVFGAVTISIGIMLGIGVFIKMNTGIFVKNLHKGK
jgi:hypothetical protein